LAEGKFKDVGDLINLIASQGNSQIAAPQKPVDDTLPATPETPPAPPVPTEPSEAEQKPEAMN